MRILTREDIHKAVTMREMMEADKRAFCMITEKKCNTPLRMNIPADKYDACFQVMPAYSADQDLAVVKMINQFPHNIEKGMPSSPAQVLLMDGKNGMFLAMIDGTTLTQVRTGAVSGAAFDLFARRSCRVGALIGTGGQAETQLEAMLESRHPEEVRVYDMNPERAQAFASRMQKRFQSFGADIRAVSDSDEAICEADLLITVTPSRTPVFDGSKLKKGVTVSCVGSYRPDMQELDPEALIRASGVYLDSRKAVLAESGDLIQPLQTGMITEEKITGELGQVLRGEIPGRKSEDDILIFETVGVGEEDLCAAELIYRNAVEKNLGLSVV